MRSRRRRVPVPHSSRVVLRTSLRNVLLSLPASLLPRQSRFVAADAGPDDN
jgi:hypothetical protein